MDKRILAIVTDFQLWRGDTYKLAALIAAEQQQIDRDKLIATNLQEAAAVI